MKKFELLAPAKDKICAKAAIDCGADAVYIGASAFGARKNVPNSLEDIKEVVEYAHRFSVKVYVTINTILTDEEIRKAQKLIKNLIKTGVDAIIIQDMGLVEFCAENNIPFHASTQCNNRTPEKIKFLENVGFSRVILARELSIKQIKEISEKTNAELETFVHGALCVSYSGQCYLSYAIGGRSANKGECAQPCRKKYSLIDEKGNFIAKDKYLLCLKDFNALRHIKELAQVGVKSFKIEGRLKDVNYVKNVVAYYRKLIDDLGLKKTSSGKILLDFEPNLEKSFNRGFTDYFLEKRGDCYSFDTPKSKGEYIGKISKTGKDFFEISFKAGKNIKISAQDGLFFFDGKEFTGCLVNKAAGEKIYPQKIVSIPIGTEIYRNFDSEFEKKLKNSKTCRKILAEIEFDLNKLSAKDEDGNFVEIEYEFEEFAKNEEKMGVNIASQLKKSGESDFLINEVRIKSKKIPFLPVSKLNELRRRLLDELMKKRINKKNKKEVVHFEPSVFTDKEVNYSANVLNKYAKEFYEKHGCKVYELALESGQTAINGKTVMTTKHCLKYAFNMCKSQDKLFLIDEKDKKYGLKFNCDKCEMDIVSI